VQSTVTISNVSQHFGAVKALDRVGLTLRPGEVRALIGANGSGKSTLVKVIAGYHTPDSGAVDVDGTQCSLSDARGVSELWKVSIVHQDLGLIDGLSILENFLLNDFSSSNELKISWSERSKTVSKYLERFGVKISPYRKINECSRVTRALIALARAVWILESDVRNSSVDESGTTGTLILDELTAFLSVEEVQLLRSVIKDIVASGYSVLFVSHDLDEIISFADQITVLRDGKCVADQSARDISKDELFTLIAGRSAEDLKNNAVSNVAETGSRKKIFIEDLSSGDGSLGPISFDFASGEVVGITGLVGSGYELVPYSLFGADKGSVGSLTIESGTIRIDRLTPPQAIQLGIALVPGDRNTQGLWSDMTIAENLTATDKEQKTNPWLISWKRVWGRGNDVVKEYAVKAPNSHTKILQLSGGNAQRVMMAKGITAKPSILLLHEPVQGVDVGSRSHIADVILDRASSGLAVLCASGDHEFLAQVASRVLVFSHGKIVSELHAKEGQQFVGKDEIVYACQNKISVDVQ
jgi:ribose transport system ATP-binding protein